MFIIPDGAAICNPGLFAVCNPRLFAVFLAFFVRICYISTIGRFLIRCILEERGIAVKKKTKNAILIALSGITLAAIAVFTAPKIMERIADRIDEPFCPKEDEDDEVGGPVIVRRVKPAQPKEEN